MTRRTHRPAGGALAALLALALVPADARALQPLDPFLAAASTQSHDAREAALLTARADAQRRAARWALAPSLSAAASYKRNQREVIVSIPAGPAGAQEAVITPFNQLDASLTLSVPLIDAARWAALDTTASAADAARLSEQDRRRLAQEATSLAYFDLVAAIAARQACALSAEAALARVKRDEARAAASTLSQLELERSRAAYAQRLQLIAQADLSIQSAAADLARLSGLAPVIDASAALESAPVPEEEAPLERWLARLEQHTAQRAARADATRADAQLTQSARAAYLPTLTLQASERLTNAAGFGPNDQWTVGVSLLWSLDPATLHALDASEADAQLALVRADSARAVARDQIALAWHTVQSLRAAAIAARAQQAASDRALLHAAQRYEAGVGPQVELLDAEAAALDAATNRVRADAQLAHARVRLRLLVALPSHATAP